MCVLSLKTIQILFLLLVVVGSDEQPTVRFRYATPHTPNPCISGLFRIPKHSQRDNQRDICERSQSKSSGEYILTELFYMRLHRGRNTCEYSQQKISDMDDSWVYMRCSYSDI